MSLLNILGLSLGIASFMVISLYVYQERSFEQGHENPENLWRIEEHFLSMGHVAWSSANLQFALEDIPEIEAYTRMLSEQQVTVLKEGQGIKADKTFTTSNSFFELFHYPLLVGDPEAPFTGPGSAVITQELAMTVFGRVDVVGEPLELKEKGDFIVSAVVAPQISRSHLDFDMLLHFARPERAASNWYNIGGYLYVRTQPGTTEAQLNSKLDLLVENRVFPESFKPSKDMGFEDWIKHENRIQFMAKPIEDIYLYSKLQFELSAGGDPQILVTLTLIAIFILVIAAINFMNLTTARSSGRTKEIGVRKVLGSNKQGLVIQFLSESLMITLISTLIAAGLSELIIFAINHYFGEVIGLSFFTQPGLLLISLLGVLLLGLLAGVYPAFYLSSAKVIPLLKGMKLSFILNLNMARSFRNGLVVTQFTLSTAMIIATIFIYQQLIYLQDKDLGFQEDQVLVVNNAHDLGKNQQAFKNAILAIPGVESASYSFRTPGDKSKSLHSVMLDANNTISFNVFTVDLDFAKTLGLKMKEGDWFNEDMFLADSIVIINNAAAQMLEIEKPEATDVGKSVTVVGIVEDFSFGSLKNEIGPAFINISEKEHRKLSIKLNASQVPHDEISAAWQQFSDLPLETSMLEQNFDELLFKEEQSANTVLAFTGLAIFISCLGLFGLAAFTADQRLHEFGIRKVLGASVGQIVGLFSYDFLKLIGMAFLISVPLSIYGVSQWLQGYADRISMSVGVFVISGLLAIAIAFFTILFQSLKTGRLNPVDTIRNE